MMHEQGKVREVAWNELFPWLILFRAIRIGLFVRILILGAIGLVATTAGWKVIIWAFEGAEDPFIQKWEVQGGEWVWQTTSHFGIATSVGSAEELFRLALQGLIQAPAEIWLHMIRPFVSMFDSDMTGTAFLCLALCGLWELVVWALAGGAITRIAALQLTRRESPSIADSLRFANRSMLSYTATPLLSFGFAAVFGIQLVLLGLVMRWEPIAVLVALIWPFALLLGMLMTIVLIGVLVGWPLMWATISVEGTDAFDAFSRSYAYTYQRPLRFLWYVVLAAFLGALGMFVVKVFASAAIALGDWSIDWGLDDYTMEAVVSSRPTEIVMNDGVMLRFAHGAVQFWKATLTALAAGYQVGYLWVAAVAIYLLLRRDIDNAEMDEVYVEEEADYGVPQLHESLTGVPEVAPSDAAVPANKTTGAQ
jgi:hypothetical protein